MKKSNWKNQPSRQTYNYFRAYRAIPRCSDAKAHDPSCKADKNEKPAGGDAAIVFWTRVVGFFTLVLAVVGTFQFWAFVQSERAFLSIISLSLNDSLPDPGDETVQTFFQMKNGGKSTAYIRYITMSMSIGQALPATPDYGDEHQVAQPPIPPDGTSFNSDNIILTGAITQADVDGIHSGAVRLSFFGYVRYTDEFYFWPFFQDRLDGFCFTYSIKPTAASPFVTCPETAYTYQK